MAKVKAKYYALDLITRTNLISVLDQAEIQGKDCYKVVALKEILHKVNEQDPFFLIDDDLVKFARGILDVVRVPGTFAVKIVQIQVALTNGMTNPPKEPKPKAPDTKPAPHGPPKPVQAQ